MVATLVMPALTGFLLMIVLAQFAVLRIERSRRRQSELQRVKDLLPRHYDALDRVTTAEALPRDLTDVLAWVSSGIDDEATAMFFVDNVFGKAASEPRLPDETTEMAALRAAHPQTMEDYDLAMSTGILASVLRWPSTAREAKRIMAEVLSSRHEATAAAFRTARRRDPSPRQTAAAGAF